MSNRALGECDGFMCGTNIKRESLPLDRIIKGQFIEGVEDVLDGDATKEWIRNWLLEELQTLMPTLVKKQWFIDSICSVNCGDTNLFEVIPQQLEFTYLGGTKQVQINVGAEDSWTAVTF